ncbi:hypothetical protein JCM8547_001574 [Rhodosporidiobolus lusitaniae]
MASHSVPFGSPSQLTSKRRPSRRLQPEGEGESSREASAESNDETGASGQEEDDDADTRSLSGPAPSSATTAAALDTGVRGLNLGRVQEVGQAATGTSREGAAGEMGGYASGESAGHDGDISSATAQSQSSISASRLASTQPTSFRAPVGIPPPQLHHQTSYRSSASLSTGGEEASDEGGVSPSPPQTETETDGETTGAKGRGKGRAKAVPSRYEGKAQAGKEEPALWAPAPKGFLSNLTAEEIQEHILRAVAGDPGRAYKIKPPPVGRPVRIYADGVYDLLHYGHMLQLRQCKLAFPSVHLLVGVCSSELVQQHKSNPVFSSEERYESMRHIRWVDEVVEDAPWTIDQAFMDKWRIDYVAHDEEPYKSAGAEDVYAFVKSIGAFLPTKRTNGISTSELLQRIVEGYREGSYDNKLIKIGHPELCSRQGSEIGTGTGGGGSVRRDSAI